MEWNGQCHRCGKDSFAFIQSMYSQELICGPCKKEEKQRPDYHLAEARDLEDFAQRCRQNGLSDMAGSLEYQASRIRDKKPL